MNKYIQILKQKDLFYSLKISYNSYEPVCFNFVEPVSGKIIEEIEYKLNDDSLSILDLPKQYNCTGVRKTWGIAWPPTAHIRVYR